MRGKSLQILSPRGLESLDSLLELLHLLDDGIILLIPQRGISPLSSFISLTERLLNFVGRISSSEEHGHSLPGGDAEVILPCVLAAASGYCGVVSFSFVRVNVRLVRGRGIPAEADGRAGGYARIVAEDKLVFSCLDLVKTDRAFA